MLTRALMGSVTGALATFERLQELDPATVVSGHGPITGPEVIEENAAYLRWVQHLAEGGVAAGCSPLETAQRAELGPYAHLPEAERLAANLHRAFAEHEADHTPPGAPLPLKPALDDMVAFNGGQPLPCTV